MKRGLFVFPNSKFWVEAIKKLIKAGYHPEVIVGDDFHKKNFKNSLLYDTSLFKLGNYPSFLNLSNPSKYNLNHCENIPTFLNLLANLHDLAVNLLCAKSFRPISNSG